MKGAPRGYARDHPRIELLRYKSVAALRSFDPAPWLGTKAAANRILGVWRDGGTDERMAQRVRRPVDRAAGEVPVAQLRSTEDRYVELRVQVVQFWTVYAAHSQSWARGIRCVRL